MPNPLTFAEQNRAAHLAELIEFLRIPSVSTNPAQAGDVLAAAEWLAASLRQAGLEHVRLVETEGHPLVYADWLHAGAAAPTVLVYGHYDVQPADPEALWETPPFEPTVKGEYLFCRGASDNKGQLFVHVKAVAALLSTRGALPVNVKFIVEGEEEIGGPSLGRFVAQSQDLLAADVALVSDTAMAAKGRPSLVCGLRGLSYALLDLQGPAHDLHSGSYGGGINNPLNALGHIIARLKDETGHILIPGFYDSVRPLRPDERALLSAFPLDEAGWLADTGAPAAWGEPEFTLVERLGARPTLDVNGIVGGYTGPGTKTVLPATAHAKVSMRLVPDQQPEAVFRQLRDYVAAIRPPGVSVTVTYAHGAQPVVTDYRAPAMRAASTALEEAFGQPPVFMREGGSIPVVGQFQAELGVETVLMGFGLPTDRIHAPNERYYLPNFHGGIIASIRFLQLLARQHKGASHSPANDE